MTGLTAKISDRDVCVEFSEARDCYFCPRFADVFLPQEELDIPQHSYMVHAKELT